MAGTPAGLGVSASVIDNRGACDKRLVPRLRAAGSSAEARSILFPLRALVFLRDGSLFGYGLLTAQTGSLIVSLPAYLQACL